MVNDAKVTPEAAVQAAQKEADALMKPYVDKNRAGGSEVTLYPSSSILTPALLP
ncbi:glycerol-3-phosphate-binding protein [Klebsiella pneumoniae]|uniref:Glycerol-3-phosphate-binding protein n=1 Tax=Klebsiella pneumoniae TaxID=573 RepID=A0A2X3GSX9_KLEPN|nr:glycerol-3-phosphate-binding protein [Klebsiella pneumoniae]